MTRSRSRALLTPPAIINAIIDAWNSYWRANWHWLVLDLIGLSERLVGAELVVTGEGTVDGTTFAGKAPSAVLEAAANHGVHAVLFGGRVNERPEGVEVHELSGDPARASDDLCALGERLATAATGRTA